MIGDKWPSEKRTFKDPKTGTVITQLTDRYINFHMYFTDNSFDPESRKIYFLSNRANPDREVFHLFLMDLETGEMEQLTDDPAGISIGRVTKTRDSQLIAYMSDNRIHLYNTETRENRVIYEEEPGFEVALMFFAPDKSELGFSRNEAVDVLPDGGPNYAGFKDKMFAIKDGRISRINLDGTGFRDVFRDTHWISHFQYSPVDPDLAVYCHEGPWNYVHQRMWMINMKTGDVWPAFRQGEDDCVGHEFWTENGDIIFDNRRGGHDGTISNTKDQVYAAEKVSTETPYFGFCHPDGTVYRTIEMPFYCNHYHANRDVTLFVGDAVEDIDLITVDGDGKTALRPLCTHNTTWKYQRSHCHPCFSWDGTKILYAADTDDWHDNIFLAEVPEDLL